MMAALTLSTSSLNAWKEVYDPEVIRSSIVSFADSVLTRRALFVSGASVLVCGKGYLMREGLVSFLYGVS